MNNQELQHFGVPGMKWGVRKQRDQLRPGSGRKMGNIERQAVSKLSKTKQIQKLTKAQTKTPIQRKKAKWSQLSTGRKVATALLRTNSVLATASIPSLLVANSSGKAKAIYTSAYVLQSIGGFALADYISTVPKNR